MTFRTGIVLWGLAATPLLLLFLLSREGVRRRIARRFASERLRGISFPARLLRPWLVALALAAAVVALAGPYRGFELVPVVVRESSRIIVIDVSNSMAAEDVGTSRLSAAKAVARRLVESHSGRVALVAFEASGEIISPLTTDTEAVVTLIESLAPGELSDPGSDIGGAVLASLSMIENDAAQRTEIIVLSDGEEQGANITAAGDRARGRNATVSGVVIGTRGGSTIPTRAGPMKDDSGQVITTFARTEALQTLASRTGGSLLENPFSEAALAPLLSGRAGGESRQTHARVPIDRYQWPLAFAFVLLLGASLLNRGAE